EIFREVRAIPWQRRLAALLCTAAGYLALTGYDALAVRQVGRRLPYRRTALASFCSYALSHNVGLGMLSGLSLRYRLYSAWGLAPLEVASVSLVNGVTFWLGFLALTGTLLTIEPPAAVAAMPLPALALRAYGLVALAAVAGYLAVSAKRRKPFEIS